MSNEQDDTQDRPESRPYGQGSGGASPYGQGSGGASPYGQGSGGTSPYGEPQPYGQQQYGQQQYGQQPYGQQPYGEQQQYAQPPYGQPPYGSPAGYDPQAYSPTGYGPYGQSPVPAKPAPVVVSAVLGFLFAALGVGMSLLVFLGGAALFSAGGLLDDGGDLGGGTDPFGGDAGTFGDIPSDAAAGIGIVFLVLGVLAVAWTVVMIWGSVWALTGRSRVLLIVGGSIAIVTTGLALIAGVTGLATGETDGVALGFFLLLFLVSVAIVALLSLRPAAQFYAAHRMRRRH